jgi:hypothetical protein
MAKVSHSNPDMDNVLGQETIDLAGQKCRVPMWMMGCPAGYCDDPAYGVQTDKNRKLKKLVGRELPYCFGFACPSHGGPTKEEAIAALKPTEGK